MLDVTTAIATLVGVSVATVSPTATLREAAAELAGEFKGVLLVSGPHGMIGVVSERDIARAIAEGGDVDEMRVEDVMTDDVVSIAASASVEVAWSLMDANEIRHVVVTRDSVPIGVLSMRDVLRAVVASRDSQ